MDPILIGSIVGLITCITCVSCCVFFIRLCQYCKLLTVKRNTHTHQQEDIYNISGSVQQQQQQPQQGQGQRSLPNNSQLPLSNLTISNETNKHNDDPPSYEEAMRLAMVASHDATNSAVSVVVPPVVPPSPTVPKLTD